VEHDTSVMTGGAVVTGAVSIGSVTSEPRVVTEAAESADLCVVVAVAAVPAIVTVDEAAPVDWAVAGAVGESPTR
jgi:hypothetical protein